MYKWAMCLQQSSARSTLLLNYHPAISQGHTCTKFFSTFKNISTFLSIREGFWRSKRRLPIVAESIRERWMCTLLASRVKNLNHELTIPARSWICRRSPGCGREHLPLSCPGSTWPWGKKMNIEETRRSLMDSRDGGKRWYRKLGESGIVDFTSKRVLLKLKQLHHQASQRFAGGRVILDVLTTHKHILH